MTFPAVPSAKQAPETTPFAQAWETVGRVVEPVSVDGFFGLADKPIPKIGFRIPVVAEQRASIEAAHAAVKNASESAKLDPDLLDNEKLIELLYRACMTPEVGANGIVYPAFPGPDWMRKNLTADHLAVLYNLLMMVRQQHGPRGREVDEQALESLTEELANRGLSDYAERRLAPYNHAELSLFLVALATKLKFAREQLASSELIIEELNKQLDSARDMSKVAATLREKFGITDDAELKEAMASLVFQGKEEPKQEV